MRCRVIVAVLVAAMFAVPAWAQRLEIQANGGYTLSEGVPVNADTVLGNLIDEVSPKSAGSWGLSVAGYVNEQFQLGFLFGQQFSTLELKAIQPIGKVDATDMTVNNYHGVFIYNFGFGDSMLRPFFLGGLGATHYSPDDIMGNAVESSTKFSTTWGGGLKLYATDNVGFNFTARWTPTYINSDPGGLWCSPYWPFQCWVLSDANYSNQFDLSGGVNIRF